MRATEQPNRDPRQRRSLRSRADRTAQHRLRGTATCVAAGVVAGIG